MLTVFVYWNSTVNKSRVASSANAPSRKWILYFFTSIALSTQNVTRRDGNWHVTRYGNTHFLHNLGPHAMVLGWVFIIGLKNRNRSIIKNRLFKLAFNHLYLGEPLVQLGEIQRPQSIYHHLFCVVSPWYFNCKRWRGEKLPKGTIKLYRPAILGRK